MIYVVVLRKVQSELRRQVATANAAAEALRDEVVACEEAVAMERQRSLRLEAELRESRDELADQKARVQAWTGDFGAAFRWHLSKLRRLWQREVVVDVTGLNVLLRQRTPLPPCPARTTMAASSALTWMETYLFALKMVGEG
ncbi:unnamed protein product [Symbiodinium natans]|uniref:Uncharacterized protein n=1 Tax=Symbiodinium natans TaxID=878477 RepID=A0A812SIS8_9DINO|nr:unnamed protein product [Symbiodinium natans]